MSLSFNQIKLERLAIAIVTVFLVTDLLPHPSLSSGLIETTFAKVQMAFTETPHKR